MQWFTDLLNPYFIDMKKTFYRFMKNNSSLWIESLWFDGIVSLKSKKKKIVSKKNYEQIAKQFRNTLNVDSENMEKSLCARDNVKNQCLEPMTWGLTRHCVTTGMILLWKSLHGLKNISRNQSSLWNPQMQVKVLSCKEEAAQYVNMIQRGGAERKTQAIQNVSFFLETTVL